MVHSTHISMYFDVSWCYPTKMYTCVYVCGHGRFKPLLTFLWVSQSQAAIQKVILTNENRKRLSETDVRPKFCLAKLLDCHFCHKRLARFRFRVFPQFLRNLYKENCLCQLWPKNICTYMAFLNHIKSSTI